MPEQTFPVRLSPTIIRDYEHRGVFAELRPGPHAIECAVTVRVSRELAAEVLKDARAQHDQRSFAFEQKGTKKSYGHLIDSLLKRLDPQAAAAGGAKARRAAESIRDMAAGEPRDVDHQCVPEPPCSALLAELNLRGAGAALRAAPPTSADLRLRILVEAECALNGLLETAGAEGGRYTLPGCTIGVENVERLRALCSAIWNLLSEAQWEIDIDHNRRVLAARADRQLQQSLSRWVPS